MTMQDPINLEAFENAVHKWFTDASGLFTAWRHQGAPQPTPPFGTLHTMTGPTPLATKWEVRRDYDVHRALGQEIRITYCVPCRLTVSCQAYTKVPEDASVYTMRAQAALNTLAVQDQFRIANIAVERHEAIRDIDVIINETWMSRSNIDVSFAATMEFYEYEGYIETVNVKSDPLHVDLTITAEV